MNPKAALLIFLAVCAAIGFLIWIAARRTSVQAVRRRDLHRAYGVIAAIEEATDRYTDIDHVLAMDVRTIIREHRKEQRNLP